MAVSLFLALSSRLQAPAAALLLLGGVQLALAAHAAPASGAVTHVRAALATPASTAPVQIVAERS